MHRLVVALTTLLSLTAATYVAAYVFLFAGSGVGAAALAPATTAIYVSLSLQTPSAQDANIERLASRLPGFADTSVLDQKIDELAQNLLAQLGLDYRRHVRPWLGPELAVAFADLSSAPTLLVAVRDDAAARDSLQELEADRGGGFDASTHGGVEVRASDGVAYAFVEQMLVVAADAASVARVIDVSAGSESLADRADFVTAMERLPADRVAALFVDLPRIVGEDSRYDTAAGALVVEPEGLVLRGRAETSGDAGASPAAAPDDVATLAAWMPPDTQVAISAFDAGELLLTAERLLADVPAAEGLTATIDSARALFAFGLGLDLDEVVRDLMRGEGGLALQRLETDAATGQLLLRPDDPAEAVALLEDVTDRLQATGASVEREERNGAELVTLALGDIGSLAYAVTDDGVIIIGLAAEAVEAALAAADAGDSLATTDEYTAAYELAGTRGGNEAVVDPRALLVLLGFGGEPPSDARDILAQLGVVALTVPDRGDHLEFHAVLPVD